MKNSSIYITDYDIAKIRKLLHKAQNPNMTEKALIEKLKNKLYNAIVISQKQAPSYLITMNCQIGISDLNENNDKDFWLVYPNEASSDKAKISIVSDIGIAVLGSKVGDTIEFVCEDKIRQLRIVRIYYQPEANDHYRL